MGLQVATYSIVEGNVAPAMERWVWLATPSGMQRARRAARSGARVGHRAASGGGLVPGVGDPGAGVLGCGPSVVIELGGHRFLLGWQEASRMGASSDSCQTPGGWRDCQPDRTAAA